MQLLALFATAALNTPLSPPPLSISPLSISPLLDDEPVEPAPSEPNTQFWFDKQTAIKPPHEARAHGFFEYTSADWTALEKDLGVPLPDVEHTRSSLGFRGAPFSIFLAFGELFDISYLGVGAGLRKTGPVMRTGLFYDLEVGGAIFGGGDDEDDEDLSFTEVGGLFRLGTRLLDGRLEPFVGVRGMRVSGDLELGPAIPLEFEGDLVSPTAGVFLAALGGVWQAEILTGDMEGISVSFRGGL